MLYIIIINAISHEFSDWHSAVKFAVEQARLDRSAPVEMSSGLARYQIWADGVIDRLETYCACDACRFCDSANGSATCPHYWEQQVWEYYDTHEE